MNKVQHKLVFALILFILTGSICGNHDTLAAAKNTTRQQQMDQQFEFPQHGLKMQYVESLPEYTNKMRLHSARYRLSSEWSVSGNDYYFSQLSTAEKKLYLQIKQEADAYITGVDDFMSTTISGKQIYILPQISYEELEGDWYEERLKNASKVIDCFLFENPQYYFMRQAFVYTTRTISVQLYDSFADGRERDSITKQFESQLHEWESGIDADADNLMKEMVIHQIVCESAIYDESVADDEDENDSHFSQSCISAVLNDRHTVCAGYAQLFTLLCNRAGLQCISVTSEEHEWNKVRMGGVWYNVDCTWDDTDPGYNMTFFNVTDEFIREKDTKDQEHILETKWMNLVPECTQEFDIETANEENIRNISTPQKMSGVIAESNVGSKIAIQFAVMEGCDGYTIQYAADKTMKPNRKKNVDGMKASYQIKGLASGTTYYVRVRGFVLDSSGTNVYGAYSKKIKVQVK